MKEAKSQLTLKSFEELAFDDLELRHASRAEPGTPGRTAKPPAPAENAADAAPSGMEEEAGNLPRRTPVVPGRGTILVADDDPSIRESLKKALRIEGFEVVLAASGDEALRRLETRPVDIVLLDLYMPQRDGWDTFERLLTANPLQGIILMSGSPALHAWAKNEGPNLLLEKPIDVPSLVAAVESVMGEPMADRFHRISRQYAFARYSRPLVPKLSTARPFRRWGVNE